MADQKLKEWTAGELVAELRLRERQEGVGEAVRERERGRAVPHRGTRSHELQHVPTAELAKLAQDRQRAIYGVDNRKDLYQVSSAKVKKVASSVVALVKTDDLIMQNDGSYVLATEAYRDAYQLCSNEPFASQPIACFCSGFLVGQDVIATAGHCVKSEADLANVRFVFDFRMVDADKARTRFGEDDVYTGKTLIGRKLASDGADWALVRLDRAVVGRNPVKVRGKGKVNNDEALFVIGHPCGLPQKYAPGAKVRDNAPAAFFVANLDTYGGNSGSPVFNAGSATVEGILVRGETDFVTNGNCYVSLVCPTSGCRGEEVTRATVWAPKVSKGKKTSGTGTIGSRTKSPRAASPTKTK
jgi:hypothetical protein